MSQMIKTFSVPKDKPEDIKFVTELADACKKRGISLSHLVLESLKANKTAQELINGKGRN